MVAVGVVEPVSAVPVPVDDGGCGPVLGAGEGEDVGGKFGIGNGVPKKLQHNE